MGATVCKPLDIATAEAVLPVPPNVLPTASGQWPSTLLIKGVMVSGPLTVMLFSANADDARPATPKPKANADARRIARGLMRGLSDRGPRFGAAVGVRFG